MFKNNERIDYKLLSLIFVQRPDFSTMMWLSAIALAEPGPLAYTNWPIYQRRTELIYTVSSQTHSRFHLITALPESSHFISDLKINYVSSLLKMLLLVLLSTPTPRFCRVSPVLKSRHRLKTMNELITSYFLLYTRLSQPLNPCSRIVLRNSWLRAPTGASILPGSGVRRTVPTSPPEC